MIEVGKVICVIILSVACCAQWWLLNDKREKASNEVIDQSALRKCERSLSVCRHEAIELNSFLVTRSKFPSSCCLFTRVCSAKICKTKEWKEHQSILGSGSAETLGYDLLEDPK